MTVESCPVRWAGRHAVATLPDEIDLLSSGQVRQALDHALAEGATVLVADMTETTFCASEGVRVLLDAHAAAGRAGAQLRIAGPGRRVRRILQLTGVGRVLDVYPSLEAALASAGDSH